MSPRLLTRRVHRVVRPAGGGPARKMNERMVDRMFWRAGFGPTEADRKRWTGKSASSLVEFMLSTPQRLVGTAATRSDGTPLQPHASDTDMVTEWIDRMVRSENPLVERLTFFWHRHLATRRSDVSPPQLMTIQNSLFRRFADFGSNPNATYTDLMFQVGEDPAMLRFLTGEDNRVKRVNENYAREVMELFCLGVTDAAGTPNYSEDDVRELAKAVSGWQINEDDPNNAFGYFTENRWEPGPKTVLGRTANFKHRDAVEVVMQHRSHAPFLITKLWHEFIVTPADSATQADLERTYLRGGRKLRPLLERILTHPLMFESLLEPNMVKSPVVFAAGLMRQLGLSIVDDRIARSLVTLEQEPYDPPTVAGWEGGLTWLNTNSTLGRFDLAQRLLTDTRITPQDVDGEAPAAAVDRAHTAVGRPWMAPGTRAALVAYATRAPVTRSRDREIRQRALRAFMLGGPDGQVM
ncbi:MAG: DUF1800 family protein [Actinobacteria bacterium]|nr:DUF1800 family protein [Thermoleophilia bacterium]MCB9010579.1 DUF1800 family protein [Actinomycetota bacterium]